MPPGTRHAVGPAVPGPTIGAVTDLTKGANTAVAAPAVRVEVGWRSGPDLDAAALLLTAAGKVRSDADFVFYNQPASPGREVRHEGRTGRREVLGVDLAGLPPHVETVAITASADGAAFGSVAGHRHGGHRAGSLRRSPGGSRDRVRAR